MNLNPNNYFIKEGYVCQDSNFTITENREENYWTPWRLELNKYFQFHVYKYARKLIRKNNLHSVLDVGCGPAVKLMQLIHPVCKDVTGVDQKEAIDVCKQQYNTGKFIVEDLENPVGLQRSFDLLISADVIEHLLNPDVLLDYLKRHARQDSLIILSTPERDLHRGIDCMASEKPEHVREWNQREFNAYLINRGFKVITHEIVPFIKSSLFNKNVRHNLRAVKKRTGTIYTCQMVVCKV